MLVYICPDDVQQVFLEHIACIRYKNTSIALLACDQHMIHDGNDSTTDSCQKHQDYHACRQDVIAEHCDDEFARIYVEAIQKLNEDPCPEGNAGVTTYQQLAPMWMVSFIVWSLLTRCLTFW